MSFKLQKLESKCREVPQVESLQLDQDQQSVESFTDRAVKEEISGAREELMTLRDELSNIRQVSERAGQQSEVMKELKAQRAQTQQRFEMIEKLIFDQVRLLLVITHRISTTKS